MAYSEAKLKSNGDKSICLFQTIPNTKHVRQMLAYAYSAIGFIQTFLLASPVSWGYQTE